MNSEVKKPLAVKLLQPQVVEPLKTEISFKSVFNSIVAASVSNMMGIAVGHPLDTMKVRMQMQTESVSFRSCLFNLVYYEGLRGLFKGMTQPLIASVPWNSGVFFIQHHSKNYMQSQFPQMSNLKVEFIAGGIGSLLSLTVLVPTDLLKCRAQMTIDGKINYKE